MKKATKKQSFECSAFRGGFLVILMLFGLQFSVKSQITMGGVNLGNLPNYHMVFTQGSVDANLQGSTRGFLGDIAINGILASERTAGSVPYSGTMYTNDATLGPWKNIISTNASQATGSVKNIALLTKLSDDLEKVFTQINALPVTAGYNGVSPTSLNGLNTKNGRKETMVINISTDFSVATRINITGDASDIYIFRWDTDKNFSNGYNGEVRFRNGAAFVPLGDLKASNFIHVAGDLKCSGGGNNPPSPYPQGPRKNNGQGPLIKGGQDFTGGGFFTGYWFTTGNPTIFKAGCQPYGETSSLSNGIFVGGWYSKTTKFSLTSGSSGVYIEPNISKGSIGNIVWNDLDGSGTQDENESGMVNITIKLFTCSGSLVATTTTDAQGAYQFNNVDPGNYYLQFTTPATYEFTLYRANDDTTLDSDVIPETGMTDCFSLANGEVNTSIDAGMNQYGTIGNLVWEDINKNGIQDAEEPGLVNVIVELRTSSGMYVSSKRTNWNGVYLFNNVEPGTYYVTFTLPPGYAFSMNSQGQNNSKDSDVNPTNGRTNNMVINAGDYYSTIDAGMFASENVPMFKVSNNENGKADPVIKNRINSSVYPNPFTDETTIEFSSATDAPNATVEIYSINGSKIAELSQSEIGANRTYQMKWSPINISDGLYIYKVICGNEVTSGRLMLSR